MIQTFKLGGGIIFLGHQLKNYALHFSKLESPKLFTAMSKPWIQIFHFYFLNGEGSATVWTVAE